MVSKKKPKIPTIGEGITKFLKTNRYYKRVQDHSLWRLWDQHLPKSITTEARPYILKKNRLTVMVSSPTLANELHLQKNRLMDTLNQAAGKKAVKDIIFQVGELPMIPSDTSPYSERLVPKADEATLHKLLHELEQIKDEEIRERFRKLINRHYELTPDKS